MSTNGKNKNYCAVVMEMIHDEKKALDHVNLLWAASPFPVRLVLPASDNFRNFGLDKTQFKQLDLKILAETLLMNVVVPHINRLSIGHHAKRDDDLLAMRKIHWLNETNIVALHEDRTSQDVAGRILEEGIQRYLKYLNTPSEFATDTDYSLTLDASFAAYSSHATRLGFLSSLAMNAGSVRADINDQLNEDWKMVCDLCHVTGGEDGVPATGDDAPVPPAPKSFELKEFFRCAAGVMVEDFCQCTRATGYWSDGQIALRHREAWQRIVSSSARPYNFIGTRDYLTPVRSRPAPRS